MTTKEMHKSINEFISDLLGISGTIVVHPDGRISRAGSRPNDYISFTEGTEQHNPRQYVLYVYSTNITDKNAVILNPLSEGTSLSREQLWFYQTLTDGFIRVFSKIVSFLIQYGSEASKEGSTISDPVYIQILKPYVGQMDDKCKKEWELISSGRLTEIINIHYIRDQKTARVVTCFSDEDSKIKTALTKVRKKTWTLLEEMFGNIFGISDLSKPFFTETTSCLKCPQFMTVVAVLVRCWNRLIPFLPIIYDENTTEETIARIMRVEGHLPRIEEYYSVAQWTGASTTLRQVVPPQGDVSTVQTATMEDQQQPKITTGTPAPAPVAQPIVQSTSPRTLEEVLAQQNQLNRFNQFNGAQPIGAIAAPVPVFGQPKFVNNVGRFGAPAPAYGNSFNGRRFG